MNLAFLYPLAWLGALAIAVPIWLHLRRRQEANLVRFSAMQFLDEEPLARRRPLWPHNWPLLLLRLAGLLALVAAFSWPYLPTQQNAALEESCVYILDNTFSHQADGRFEKARDEIAAALSAAGMEKQIAVIELTALPRTIVAFGDDRTAAIQRVRALKPSFQRGSYLAAFRSAGDLLSRSLGQRRHIVLLGDNQENQWTEAGRVLPFLKDVEVTLPEVAAASRSNVALTNPAVRRMFVDDRAVAECAVRLYHLGEQKTAALVFHANGKDVARREVPLARGTRYSGSPESINVSVRWETDPAQWLFGEVRLEGKPNVLPGGDRVVFSLAPVVEGRLLLLAQSPFLRVALSPEIMKGRWKSRVLSASDLRDGHTQPEDDVLCVESHYLQAAPARRLVQNYLAGGRGVLLVVDQATPLISAFLRDLGMENISEAPQTPGAHFRYLFMEHPIFQPFRSADFGNLMEIEIQRHRRLAAPSATPLAYSSDGEPLFLEFPLPRGKLFVLCFALDRTETNWPIHPTFIPFLDRCLDQARPQRNVQTAYEPGDTALWQLPAGRQAKEVVLRSGPAGDAAEAARAAVSDGQARLPVPDAPGLYAIGYDGSPEVESVLAVNPSPEESRLTYVAGSDVVCSWTSRDAGGQSSPAAVDSALQITKEEILRQQLWWWLAVAGLGALMIETTWVSLRKARA